MITGFLKLVSPSQWVMIGMAIIIGILTLNLTITKASLKTAKAETATLTATVGMQNVKIWMFREEARLMGESLKRIKLEAAKLRAESRKKATAIIGQPIIAECHKAVAASTRAAQKRLSEVHNDAQ